MRKGVVAFLSLLIGLGPLVGNTSAAEYSLVSDTLLRVFERDTAADGRVRAAPLYQYLQADVANLGAVEGLSLHFYGWGRVDLGDDGFFRDDTAGEVLYLFLDYREPRFGLRLGRQYVFEGVANESIDGVRLSSGISPWFTASLYGGQPVALDAVDGRSGDSIFGGRIGTRLYFLQDLGVSYKQVRNDGDREEERLGGDLSLALPYGIGLHGLSSYNLETSGWGEHSYELRIPWADFLLRPFYSRFHYEDFFAAGVKSPSPFRFLAATDTTLDVVGADLLWQTPLNPWELGAKFKHHDYDRRLGTAQFYSLVAIRHWSGLTQAGGEVGRMDGDRGENRFWLGRLYAYWDQLPQNLWLGFVTGDVVHVRYDEALFGRNSSFFVSLGAGRRFLADALELRLSGDYSRNPYQDDDLRGMLTARYLFGI